MIRHVESHKTGKYIKHPKTKHKKPKIVPYEHFYCYETGETRLQYAKAYRVLPPDDMKVDEEDGTIYCRKCGIFNERLSENISAKKAAQVIKRMEHHEKRCKGK